MEVLHVVLTHLLANATTMAVVGVVYFNYVLWSEYLITYVITVQSPLSVQGIEKTTSNADSRAEKQATPYALNAPSRLPRCITSLRRRVTRLLSSLRSVHL